MANLTDKAYLRRLQAELTEAMRFVCDAHGLDLAPRGGSFTSVRYTGKWDFTARPEPGGKSVEQRQFEQDAPLYGLKPEHYDALITWGFTPYKLRGISLRRAKYPVHAVRVDNGKAYKLPLAAIKGLVL